MGVDEAVRTASWEAVAAEWQRATIECFKGSSRTGGLCADLPGEPGAAIPVEVVTISINGPVPTRRALAWLRDLLDGNPATLSFVAKDEAAGRLYAAYAIEPRVHPWSSDGDFVVSYLWFVLDASAEQPIVAIDPIATTGDPLAYWREAGEPGELIALDPALVTAEKARDTAFATQVAQAAGSLSATASADGGR